MNNSNHPQTDIFLNGVSSSGKTTIAKILQTTLPEPYLHVQLDTFEEMLPERYGEGGAFDWLALFPRLLSGFHHSIAELAVAGNNLIVDHVAVTREGWHSSLIECAYLLMPFRAYLVGVYCPLDELLRRMPGLTASDERLSRPFARTADRERFLEGLRKAGMPA